MKGLFTKSCALAVVSLGALTAMNSENDFTSEKMSKRYMKTHQDRFTCDIDEARGYAHYERVEGRKGLKVNLDERGSILSIRANGVNDPHKASLFALGYVDKAHKSQQKIAKGFPRVKLKDVLSEEPQSVAVLSEEEAAAAQKEMLMVAQQTETVKKKELSRMKEEAAAKRRKAAEFPKQNVATGETTTPTEEALLVAENN